MSSPVCPRCGYDLEGLIATWKDSCPLHATCSECGLEFECSRALSPHLIGPRWSYEHGFKREARRWWATSAIALLPRKMFRELGVDHQIRARRLMRLAILWVLIVHVATATVAITLEAWAGGVGRFGLTLWETLFEPRFWVYEAQRLAFPYSAELWIATGRFSSMRVPLAPLYMLVYFPTLLMPAWMVILSSSMRTARVRRVHLLRGAAFALPCAAVYAGLFIGAIIVVPLAKYHVGIILPDEVVLAVLVLCVGHHLHWWFMFVRRYLRLRHATAVVTVFTGMNVLVLMIAFTVLAILNIRF